MPEKSSTGRFILFRPSDIIVGCVTLGFFLGAYMAYPEYFRTVGDFALRKTMPCTTPVTYRIGTIDPRFKLTSAEVKNVLSDAANVWNTAAGRTLLKEDEKNGIVTVNFVYTKQEDATRRMAAAQNADQYNMAARELSDIYDVGEFSFVHGQENIDVYAFDGHGRLLRTVAHELGHALWMDHDTDPDSIMYHLISTPDTHVTVDDYNELRRACTGVFGNKELQ